MIVVECPYPGCGETGVAQPTREMLRAKRVWLCEHCSGILPIRIVPLKRRDRRRSRWDD